MLPSQNLIPEVFIYHHGLKCLPPSVVQKLDGKDIIDLGASFGDSACVLSNYNGKGKIYSFEVDEHAYSLLLKTLKLNNLESRVVPVKIAVGQKSGKVKFDFFPRDIYFHHFQRPLQQFDCISIDDFFKNKSHDIGLIKLDIEGFEYEALLGAEKTIKSFKPIILASVYHTGKDFFEIPRFLQKCCSDYKFKLFLLNEEYPLKEITLCAF